jgi:thioredoxin 1
MKKYFTINLFAIVIMLNSCSNGQTQNTKSNLSATEFADKLKELPMSPILDVRTPEEFSKGHLTTALNYNWNGDEFDKQISNLDKTKPVFVYCLSGGRSSSAANKMRSDGFKEVYELDGGIMKWRAANFPESTDEAAVSKGMSKQQFEALFETNKIVLIDFYADWCAPCKKMKPYLDEIAKEMSGNVEVIRINADDNQSLCKELEIDALPVLQIYTDKKMTWSNVGYIDKEEVVKHLK